MIHLSIFTVVIFSSNFVWSYLRPSCLTFSSKPAESPCQGGGYKYYWNTEAKKCSLFYDCGNSNSKDLHGNTYGSFLDRGHIGPSVIIIAALYFIISRQSMPLLSVIMNSISTYNQQGGCS